MRKVYWDGVVWECMISEAVEPVRESGREIVSRMWKKAEFVRAVPTWALLRLATVSGVSARVWRNAIVTVVVGIVSMVFAVAVLRNWD